jgi:hypothetical protein
VQPVGGEAGKTFPTQPEVVVLDFYGNSVTSYQGSITLAMAYGPKAASVLGTTTVLAVNGVAHFTDIMMTLAYPDFKVMASGSSLEQVTSRSFRVTATTPVKLVFTVQVEGAKAGQPFEEQPAVAVEDKYSNVVDDTGITVNVDLTLGTGTAGAVLSGTKILVADDALGGVAAYEDLAIDKAGKGYTLTATADGLSADTSAAFDVAAP